MCEHTYILLIYVYNFKTEMKEKKNILNFTKQARRSGDSTVFLANRAKINNNDEV